MVVLVSVPVMLATFVAVAPPVKPIPVGNDQLYKVPAGTIPFVTFVGDTVNNVPLQVVLVNALMVAIGLMVTVNVNAAPEQVPDKGVTV